MKDLARIILLTSTCASITFNQAMNIDATNQALIQAAKNGDLAGLIIALSHGATAKNEAFLWAVETGKLDAVCYLVQQGADIHTQNDLALIKAIYNQRFFMFNNPESLNLGYKVFNEYFNIIQYLIGKGANARNDVVITYAILWGSDKVNLYLQQITEAPYAQY